VGQDAQPDQDQMPVSIGYYTGAMFREV
jgi:hypothetical protein